MKDDFIPEYWEMIRKSKEPSDRTPPSPLPLHTFKSPTEKLPMKAKQAAALANVAYKKIYEESVQNNLTRWKEKAIDAIDTSANCGNYDTFIWIYKTIDCNETEAFGLEDFCIWLRGFGYEVTTSEMRILISWEDAR